MKRTFILTLLAILVITPFCACKKVSRDTDPNYPKPERYKMKLTIGNKTFTATLDEFFFDDDDEDDDDDDDEDE